MPGAIGWAPALLPSRGGVIAHPKVQSRNSDSARCDWEIKEVAEAALLPVAPTLRSGKLDRPVKYRFFRRCDILTRDEKDIGLPASRPCGRSLASLFNNWRPHRSIGQRAPCAPATSAPRRSAQGQKVIAIPVLGSLHHVYQLAA